MVEKLDSSINNLLISIADLYDKARLACLKAEETSNVDTEPDVTTRKRRPNKKFDDTDSSDEEAGPSKSRYFKYSSSSNSDDSDNSPLVLPGTKVSNSPNTPQFHESATKTKETSTAEAETTATIPEVKRSVPLLQMELQAIKAVCIRNESKLNILMSRKSEKDGLRNRPTDMPHLPLATSEDFTTWESYLKEEKDFDLASNFLSVFGGSDVKQAVRAVLRNIFTDKLAKTFNWKGGKGKMSLQETKTKDLVFSSVRKTFDTATILNVKQEIQSWLKNAPKRDNKRRRSMPTDPATSTTK